MNKNSSSRPGKGPVRCDQTGEVFRNANQAARQLGLPTANLYNHLNGILRYSHVAGYTFTKNFEGIPFVKKPMLKTGAGRSRPIRCEQTGEVFPSISHAARSMNLHEPNLNMHVNGHPTHNHCGGYTFKLVDS